MRVVLDIGLLEHVSVEHSAALMMQLFEVIVGANLAYLALHPETPHPLEARIRYEREPRGHEHWQGIGQIIASGKGDCEDLATYLVAWLRFHGERDARPYVRGRLIGRRRVFHVMVRRADGSVEDPSRALGM